MVRMNRCHLLNHLIRKINRRQRCFIAVIGADGHPLAGMTLPANHVKLSGAYQKINTLYLSLLCPTMFYIVEFKMTIKQ